MVGEAGEKATTRRRPRLPLYFFLKAPVDDESGVLEWKLFRKLKIDRSNDVIYTWCYPDASRVAFTYSDTLKKYERGFTLQEVCSMINRKRWAVEMAIVRGDITTPPFTYDLASRKKFKYIFHEENILEAHDFFSSRHRGRPRKDGIIIPQGMPSKRELKALIRQNEILYVKQGDEFVPTWRATDF